MRPKIDLIALDQTEQLVIAAISMIRFSRANGSKHNITDYRIAEVSGLNKRTVKSALLRMKNKLKIKEFQNG